MLLKKSTIIARDPGSCSSTSRRSKWFCWTSKVSFGHDITRKRMFPTRLFVVRLSARFIGFFKNSSLGGVVCAQRLPRQHRPSFAFFLGKLRGGVLAVPSKCKLFFGFKRDSRCVSVRSTQRKKGTGLEYFEVLLMMREAHQRFNLFYLELMLVCTSEHEWRSCFEVLFLIWDIQAPQVFLSVWDFVESKGLWNLGNRLFPDWRWSSDFCFRLLLALQFVGFGVLVPHADTSTAHRQNWSSNLSKACAKTSWLEGV